MEYENLIDINYKKPPNDKSSLLLSTGGVFFVGRERYGCLGEPQQDVYAYRCDSSGRFSEVSRWTHLPPTEPIKWR